MNYYKRYMGDYLRDTGHLSLAEHGVYTLLLDHIYSLKAELPADLQTLCRIVRARTKAEMAAVKKVANEFFPLTESGRRMNARAGSEIQKWQIHAQHNREVGILGGRPKKITNEINSNDNPSGNPDGNPEITRAVTRTVTQPVQKETRKVTRTITRTKPSPDPISQNKNSVPSESLLPQQQESAAGSGSDPRTGSSKSQDAEADRMQRAVRDTKHSGLKIEQVAQVYGVPVDKLREAAK